MLRVGFHLRRTLFACLLAPLLVFVLPLASAEASVLGTYSFNVRDQNNRVVTGGILTITITLANSQKVTNTGFHDGPDTANRLIRSYVGQEFTHILFSYQVPAGCSKKSGTIDGSYVLYRIDCQKPSSTPTPTPTPTLKPTPTPTPPVVVPNPPAPPPKVEPNQPVPRPAPNVPRQRGPVNPPPNNQTPEESPAVQPPATTPVAPPAGEVPQVPQTPSGSPHEITRTSLVQSNVTASGSDFLFVGGAIVAGIISLVLSLIRR